VDEEAMAHWGLSRQKQANKPSNDTTVNILQGKQRFLINAGIKENRDVQGKRYLNQDSN